MSGNGGILSLSSVGIFGMQLHTGTEHFGKVIKRAAYLNVAVANEAVVKRVNYILEMSQNDEYFFIVKVS
jgi:hypothetical protein